jgi:hypothetical protein
MCDNVCRKVNMASPAHIPVVGYNRERLCKDGAILVSPNQIHSSTVSSTALTVWRGPTPTSHARHFRTWRGTDRTHARRLCSARCFAYRRRGSSGIALDDVSSVR